MADFTIAGAPAELWALHDPRAQGIERWEFRGEAIQRGWQDKLTGLIAPQGCAEGEILLDGPAGTGKSLGIGLWLLHMGSIYPGSRILFVRKTRKSLTESFLATWENKVLGPGHPLIGRQIARTHREKYVDPESGTEYVTGGLDNAQKLFSTEYDIIFVNEANDIVLQPEWESFHRALRNHRMPFQLLIGDCNPSYPDHFLNQRCITHRDRARKTLRLRSLHIDNPMLVRTAEGRRYLERLANLTGVTRKRLYEGLWVAAEGMIWPTFEEATNLVYRHLCPQRHAYFGGLDFGFNAPGSLVILGVDQWQRHYVELEWYRSGEMLDWWAERILEAERQCRGLRTIFADSAEPRSIRQLNHHLRRHGSQVFVRGVKKRPDATTGRSFKKAANELVRNLFHNKGKRGPLLFLTYDSVQEAQMELRDEGRPWDLRSEILQYCYRETDENRRDDEEVAPGCQNHACDALIYAEVGAYLTEWVAPRSPDEPYAPDSAYVQLRHKDVWEQAQRWQGPFN